MFYVPWSPRGRIPRKYLSWLLKIHTFISWNIIVLAILYTILWWLYFSFWQQNTTQKKAENSVAILIDTSLSMTAADVVPNRYTHALGIASGIISWFPAEYITIPFGAIPIIRTPFSQDRNGIQQVLWQYSLWSYHVNDAYMWSAPWNAIGIAWSKLSQQSSIHKTIILLWDGNTNTWYTIDTFIPLLQKDNIKLIICAIWQSWYVLWTNYADTAVVSSLDVARLDFLTQKTWGKRRICNNIQESVDRITMRLKEQTVIDTWHSITLNSIWENRDLRYLLIAWILYMILTQLGTYIYYEIYRFTHNHKKRRK